MEFDFQSFDNLNEQLKNIANAIDSKIDTLEFILLHLQRIHEQNGECGQIRKSADELEKARRSMLLLAGAAEQVSYKYMRSEKKVLLNVQDSPFHTELSLVRYDENNEVNLFLKENSIRISFDDKS